MVLACSLGRFPGRPGLGEMQFLLSFGSWHLVCSAEEPNSAKNAHRQLLELLVVAAL
jgi:hypothetical protein